MKRGVFGGLAAVCGSVVLALLCLAPLGAYAYADESVASDDDIVTVTARAHSVDPDGWSATVTYEKPQAGSADGVHDYCRWRPEGFRQLPVPAGLYLQVRPLYLDIRPHFPSCRDLPGIPMC